MKENILIDLLRGIFAMLDRVVYGLVTTFYNTIVDLSSVQIVSGDQINEMTGRIYAYLGIFMLFKISFSLISYLVDPDKIVDKAKGGGQLIKNIVITFVLIISVPFGFDMLYEAQGAILSDNILPKLIFSDDTANINKQYQVKMAEDCNNIASTNNAGDYVGLMIFRPFFTIDDKADSTDWAKIKDVYCAANSTGNEGNASVRNLLKYSDIYSAPHGFSVNKYYVVDYSFIISTAVGIFVALLFLSFCFDVAVRMLKLLFLELIAPIPIISFIDPDSSKNGMWKKWLKEVGKTWISLFIRLITVYFAVYIIGLLSESELQFLEGYNFDGSMLWLKALIAIGALMFAKSLPKIIEDILGLKLGDSLQLNPFKKIADTAIGGKGLTALGAGAVGAVGGGIAGFTAGGHAGAPFRGVALGMLNGFNNGKADTKHAFSKGMSQTYKNMTGNEMLNMTPSKLLLSAGGTGKKKVGEMKGHLTTARTRSNAAQARLNQITHHNALAGEKLRAAGINTNNYGETKANLNRKVSELSSRSGSLSAQVTSAKNNYDVAKNKYNQAKELVENYKPSVLDSNGNPVYSAQYSDAKNLISEFENTNRLSNYEHEYNKLKNEYSQISKEYNETKEMLNTIDTYESSLEEEETLRGDIAKIEKEISTLSDEKKQRERYWQVDTSPKTSVQEAMEKNPIEESKEKKE